MQGDPGYGYGGYGAGGYGGYGAGGYGYDIAAANGGGGGYYSATDRYPAAPAAAYEEPLAGQRQHDFPAPLTGLEFQPSDTCPKNYVIFDQTYDRSRVMFHPSLANNFGNPAGGYDYGSHCYGYDHQSYPGESAYQYHGCGGDDGGGGVSVRQKEDTDEIDALMSRDAPSPPKSKSPPRRAPQFTPYIPCRPSIGCPQPRRFEETTIMATTAPPEDAEPPECPVCLSPFDAASAVPRVLPCGHSLCGPCIVALPPASAAAAGASSLRCPLCSQCVPFARALGPSSLPKNLALLALLPSPSHGHALTATPGTAPPPLPRQLPLHAAHARLLSRFRHAVLPESASPLCSEPSPVHLAFGSIDSDLGAPWFCARGLPVSLLPIETQPIPLAKQEAEFYRPSHAARVLTAIDALSNAAKEELAGLIASSARLARLVCRLYGVWMSPDAPPLWMVSERHPRTVSQLLEEEIISREETVVQTGFLVMEACEVIMGLHSEGLVLGCLGLDCFCLDRFGHCLLDLNQVLALCRGVKAGLSSNSIRAFMAPEVAVVLGDTLRTKDRDFDCLVGCSSDIWSLGCVFVALLTRDEQLVASWNSEGLYDDWEKEVVTRLDASLLGTILEPLSAVISSCLRYDPKCRPEIADVWKCIRGLLTKSGDVTLAPDDEVAAQKSFRCLLLGELSSMFVDSGAVESDDKTQLPRGADDNSLNQDHESNDGFLNNRGNDLSGIDGPQSAGVFKSSTLLAHRDCVTGLAVGGGFLFSSSYDKTINVWSLQDFSLVQCLKGHEHKITAIVAVDNDSHSLCISGDSGSGIFVWHVDSTLKEEPLNKWYEHNDWLYRGVNCLAVSGTGYLYTGSRDKSIKAWSLEDYSLRCTMTGHKSTVSCLVVASGILYSGSWDGTIRLWWLTDHTPLSVLEDDTAGSIAPVLSISAEANFVASSYENGYFKIWKNNMLVKSEKLQNGAVYAVKLSGKWLYTGGWDKVINIQELLDDESEVELRDVASITCDSIITSILPWDERLIVGLSNRDIKVYCKAS